MKVKQRAWSRKFFSWSWKFNNKKSRSRIINLVLRTLCETASPKITDLLSKFSTWFPRPTRKFCQRTFCFSKMLKCSKILYLDVCLQYANMSLWLFIAFAYTKKFATVFLFFFFLSFSFSSVFLEGLATFFCLCFLDCYPVWMWPVLEKFHWSHQKMFT